MVFSVFLKNVLKNSFKKKNQTAQNLSKFHDEFNDIIKIKFQLKLENSKFLRCENSLDFYLPEFDFCIIHTLT